LAIANGSGSCSIAKRHGGATNGSSRACATPNCASRPASKTSIIAARAGLDRALFQKLASGEWIVAHDNLALVGPTGVGKSWLASALGHKACRDNRSVLYHRVPKLFEELALAHGDGRHPRILRNLGRADLLILDDWGLEPLDAAARHDLFEILEGDVRRSLPPSFPWTAGTRSSAIPPTPTPSWTASFTTLIESN
jgi:IstB-like ATP binding protein